MRKILSLLLVMVIVSMNAFPIYAEDTEKPPSKTQIQRKFFEGCLSSGNVNDKYGLYQKCIGKFTKECFDNQEKYEYWLKDISVGFPVVNCMEMESQWWIKLFNKQAKELRRKVQTKNDKEISDALEATLADLKNRIKNDGCAYDAVSKKDWNPARIYSMFSCYLDVSGETSITAYILNNDTYVEGEDY